MIVHLSGEVNYEMFDVLIKSFNNSFKEEILHIYFTSPTGGLSDVAEAIIDFINTNKKNIKITFYGEIFSAGMYIFLYTQCEKAILKDTRGMFHFSWQSLSISEGGKPYNDYDIFCLEEMKKSRFNTLKLLKLTKLTVKEISLIKMGKEVHFTNKRMVELL